MTDKPDPRTPHAAETHGPVAGPAHVHSDRPEHERSDALEHEHSVFTVIAALRQELNHLERHISNDIRHVEAELEPAWRRSTAGEHRLPVALAIAIAIGLQLALPGHLTFRPGWLLPALEVVLLIGLIAANPRRINRSSSPLRAASLTLIAIISLDNAWSAGALISGLLNGTEGSDAGRILANGAAVYLTNIIVFGLWYWDFDRGGPAKRAEGVRRHPDFLFPQMANPELAPIDWTPAFFDYLYLSFTNATAFSPTDVMPFSRWAKALMLIQSAVALSTVALVVARAVNILK